MREINEAFHLAFTLIFSADAKLLEIISLSLKVSLVSIFISCIIGLILGATIAINKFQGRGAIIIFFNSLMGLPPVVVGLMVYIALSNAGPFGWMQLLYTPSAMIIAQSIIITPIITALSYQIISDLHTEYAEQFRSLCVPKLTAIGVLLMDAKYSLLTVILAGFGRAISEVGAVIIVGGNINHLTRVMTTSIALETSKGDLALALALGMILMSIAIVINAAVMMLRLSAVRYAYA